MGSTLLEKGNLVMSDWNYAQRYGANNLKQVRIRVLTLEKGADEGNEIIIIISFYQILNR